MPPPRPATLGVDIGGTKTLAMVVSGDGEVLAQARGATPRSGEVDECLTVVERLAAEVTADRPIAAVGVGFPGLADATTGTVRSSVILQPWREVPLARRLEDTLGLPCRVDNDVNQAARAEGELRGERDFLFAAVGTGIGAALVLGGRMVPGAHGLAGELGHLTIDRDGPPCTCGRRGCLNVFASGRAVEARLGLDKGALPAAVAAGEPDALAAVDEAAVALGEGLANVANLLDLPLLVVGGGLGGTSTRYLERVRATLDREAFDEIAAGTRLEPAQAGYEAGAVGAALHAREALGAG